MSLHIIILAAGQGKRMYSDVPKVLHTVGGKPLLARVVDVALQLNPEAIHVIIGHQAELIKSSLPHLPVSWEVQKEQLGTGHAVLQSLPHINEDSSILVLYGDVPLIEADTLHSFIHHCQQQPEPSLGLLLAELDDPTGLGRVIRTPEGQVSAIVEEKDSNEQQKKIKEIYSGICYAKAKQLNQWLPQLSNQNTQKEYYLTEIITMAIRDKCSIVTELAPAEQISGVNNRLQLEEVERLWQKKQAKKLLLEGVSIADASRIDIRGELSCERDVFIDINTIFIGQVHLGKGCKIGANSILKDVTLEPFCDILPNSVLEDSHIGEHSQIGPMPD